MAETKQLDEILEGLRGLNDRLDKQATPPKGAAPVGKDGEETVKRGPAVLDPETQLELRREMSTWSTSDLHRAFSIQATKGTREGRGIPIEAYGDPMALAKMQADPEMSKLLDVGGAGALIRQDLEPILYAIFVKRFPLFDRINKEPSNGLVHAYNRVTTFGDAQFITDVGAVTDDASVYQRATTNIGVLATRRGISLKAQFAVAQGGMNYRPETEEISNGILAITRKLQKTILQGNSTDNVAAGEATEKGAFDANAFDGLRLIQRSTNDVTVGELDPTERIINAINRGIVPAVDAGGMTSILVMPTTVKRLLDAELEANLRYQPQTTQIAAGITVNTVNTVEGPLPILMVPGDTFGQYTFDSPFAGADTVQDIYALDESRLSMPWLGSESPTVLEIPVGVSGVLTRLYIIFCMYGLAHKSPSFQAKIRVSGQVDGGS